MQSFSFKRKHYILVKLPMYWAQILPLFRWAIKKKNSLKSAAFAFPHCLICCSFVVQSQSHALLFATPWTVAHQAPLSMGFSQQEFWSGLPFPSPGNLPDPGIKPMFPALAGRSVLLSYQGSTVFDIVRFKRQRILVPTKITSFHVLLPPHHMCWLCLP